MTSNVFCHHLSSAHLIKGHSASAGGKSRSKAILKKENPQWVLYRLHMLSLLVFHITILNTVSSHVPPGRPYLCREGRVRLRSRRPRGAFSQGRRTSFRF